MSMGQLELARQRSIDGEGDSRNPVVDPLVSSEKNYLQQVSRVQPSWETLRPIDGDGDSRNTVVDPLASC